MDSLLQAVLFCALLALAAWCDLTKRIIPDLLSIAVAAVSLLQPPPHPLGVLSSVSLLVAAMADSGHDTPVGGGDIKLVAAVGVVLGPINCLMGLAASLLLLLLYLLLFDRSGFACKDTCYPLAPFMAMGFVFTYFMGGTL